ncbi:MAG TPA: MCE family protein [Acidimicrobiales bacterium]|jgi:phospholipid/cholesterol/gamma-HCH transport system substrate-binding protein|nr:MCE family protein [Acidimicrobiales bacterium]
MKRFSERNHVALAVVGSALLVVVALGAINFSKLPLINDHTGYGAAFADSAGLAAGDPVSVAGVDVGTVSGLSLSGSHVLVQFTVQNGVHLGGRTAAAAKVLTPLGQEYLDLEPAGTGQMAAGAVIPETRTQETQTIVSTIRAGANVVQGINLQQLEQALVVTNQDLEAVPPGATADLLKGLSQLSNVIASRSGELAQLVQNVSQLTATLQQHGSQLFTLIGQSDLVLQVLNQRHAAIDQLLKSTASLTQQLQALLASHQAQIGPLLGDLQTVSGVLAKDGTDIAAAIPLLAAANKYLANVTGSGAFGDFVMPAGLIPDNIIAQCTKPGATKPVTGCNP